MTAVGASVRMVWSTPLLDQPSRNLGFLLDMDRAMKAKVSGLQVTDAKTGAVTRRVPVYFNRPPAETRDVTFPYILINLLSQERASDREQRSGRTPIPYTPRGYTAPTPRADPTDTNGALITDSMPIPYDFTWQVASHARFVEHDREIIFEMMQDERIPPRFGYLVVNDTIRTMDLLSGPTNADGYDDSGKRIYRKTWLVRASAEFFQSDIRLPVAPTTTVVDYRSTIDGGVALR